jgi:hypothetical protein
VCLSRWCRSRSWPATPFFPDPLLALAFTGFPRATITEIARFTFIEAGRPITSEDDAITTGRALAIIIGVVTATIIE